ncbi:hypothetical protein Hsero_3480 [Herbaspirillum seropedicae SmR1]|uniref:Uncharacterized protein n=1 Tax=Herbaspirillum seropedicae (strain SmR1) TaxID=757424 RepID=D8IPR2_HERSS|nr:hypothetical protein Hsero_3480 [Herbaspirillum seropedicae SmR1]
MHSNARSLRPAVFELMITSRRGADLAWIFGMEDSQTVLSNEGGYALINVRFWPEAALLKCRFDKCCPV